MSTKSSTPTTLGFLAPAYLAQSEPEAGAAHEPTDTPPPAGDTEPPGNRLARALEAGLKARGWHVDYTWTTYTGHAMDARRVTTRYDVELALTDAERGAWRLSARRRTGLMQNLFKRRAGEAEEVEHQLLRAHLEEALRADPDVVLSEVAGAVWQPETA